MDVCPLSGKPCSLRKITHVTELKGDGSFVELHMCKECTPKYIEPETVKKEPVVEPAPLAPAPAAEPDPSPTPSILEALFGLLMSKAVQQKKIEVTPKIEQKPPCPSCGATVRDIARTGKLGCPLCYEHFDNEMKIVTKHAHAGATQHVGKTPKNAGVVKQQQPEDLNASIEERIKSYKLKMAKAVEIENYEAAGDLKKKIAELQQQLVTDEIAPTPPSSGDQ